MIPVIEYFYLSALKGKSKFSRHFNLSEMYKNYRRKSNSIFEREFTLSLKYIKIKTD